MFLGRWQIDQHPEVGQFVAVGNLQKAADLPHDFRGIAGQLFTSHLADWLPAREKGINSPLENLVPNQPSQLNSPLLEEMVAGLIDADLGGGVVKKRVGLSGRGKRGGARTLVATNRGTRWFFVFGFEKNERSNISDGELEALQSLAADLLARTAVQLELAVADGTLQEICHGDQS